MKRLLAVLLLCLLPSLAQAASCTSYPFTLQNNTTADATQVMANFNTVRGCVVNNAAGSGVNTDITALLGLTTPLAPGFGGSSAFIGGTSGGLANAQTVASTTPTGFSLVNGYRVTFTVGGGLTNTGPATLNINSSGATAVNRVSHAGLEALTGGEMVAGNIVEAIYNGSVLVLLNTGMTDIGQRISIAAAMTTDLGTVPTHNAAITGSAVAITSFGSTATVTEPIYNVVFGGANTLTYNATSLLIPGLGNITTAQNDSAVVEYLGGGNWQVLSYTRANGGGVVGITPLCGALNLSIKNNAGTPNTQIDVSADAVVMINPTGNIPIYRTSVAFTINLTNTNVVNGSDGARPTSNWTNIYAIDDGTTTGGYASSNAAGSFATTPTGYTYRCRLGAMSLDGSQNLYRTQQVGNILQYKPTALTNTLIAPQLGAGVVGTFSLTSPVLAASSSIVAASFCPPTTAAVQILAYTAVNGSATASVLVAPDTAWGGTNNGPQGSGSQSWPIYLPVAAANSGSAWMSLTTTTIAWASNNTGGAISVMACRDKVNAN